ncbi:hypothetical protein TNCV_2108161 [Trichonephila clavipes]|nr:hypothetical protein TNCV_2108161 [Trichonephila clavipes]
MRLLRSTNGPKDHLPAKAYFPFQPMRKRLEVKCQDETKHNARHRSVSQDRVPESSGLQTVFHGTLEFHKAYPEVPRVAIKNQEETYKHVSK